MTVFVDKHLGLKYFAQALLVDKVEVQFDGVLICETIRKTTIIGNNRIAQIKEEFSYKHIQGKMGIEYGKKK